MHQILLQTYLHMRGLGICTISLLPFWSFCSEFKTLKHFVWSPLAVLTVVTNVVIIPNLLNLVTYLHGTMHMGVSASATTTTNFFGATSGFAMIAAFLSDSYITRFRTMLLFGPFMFLVIWSSSVQSSAQFLIFLMIQLLFCYLHVIFLFVTRIVPMMEIREC